MYPLTAKPIPMAMNTTRRNRSSRGLLQDKVERYPSFKLKQEDGSIKEIKSPDKVTKATFAKSIRKQYKAKADRILQFLVSMMNDYFAHGLDASGAGYHSAKKLWNSEKDREMTWEEKAQLMCEQIQ